MYIRGDTVRFDLLWGLKFGLESGGAEKEISLTSRWNYFRKLIVRRSGEFCGRQAGRLLTGKYNPINPLLPAGVFSTNSL